MHDRITPVILTFNEAPNLARTLSRLGWAREVVVVDSGSSDGTREIAARHPGVRVVERPFTTHAEQWNFAIKDTGITTEWVLALDADFLLSDEVVAEIGSLLPADGVAGYRASFDYCIGGRPLRGAAYPPVVVLFRRTRAHYRQDGHTQRVHLDGGVEALRNHIRHDDRKPLSHWLAAQSRYMKLEADKLTQAPGSLPAIDRLRKAIVIMPPVMFFYCYLLRGGVLDGWAGLYYALQRTAAEAVLSLYLLERRIGRPG